MEEHRVEGVDSIDYANCFLLVHRQHHRKWTLTYESIYD